MEVSSQKTMDIIITVWAKTHEDINIDDFFVVQVDETTDKTSCITLHFIKDCNPSIRFLSFEEIHNWIASY